MAENFPNFRQIFQRIWEDTVRAVRTTSPDDPINDPDLYALIDGKRVLRTSPLNNTSILSVMLDRLTRDVTFDGMRSTFPDNDYTNLLEFLYGDEVVFKLEIVYNNISWSSIRQPRPLETGAGETLETGDGQVLTEG